MLNVKRLTTALLTASVILGSAAVVFSFPAHIDIGQCRQDTWSARDGLPSPDIYAIRQTPDGFLWMATTGGLVRFDGVNFDVYTSTNSNLSSNNVTAIAVDTRGRLWVAADESGVGTFEGGIYHPVVPPTKAWSTTYAIVAAPDGSVYASYRQDKTFVFHISPLGKCIPIPAGDNAVRSMSVAPGGKILCVRESIGLGVIDGDRIDMNKPAGVPTATACVAAGATDGVAWIGSQNDGIFEVDGKTVRHFTVKDGLPSNAIDAIYRDTEDRIWAGTTGGLAVLNGNQFTIAHATALTDAEVTALMEDREGSLWIGGGNVLFRAAPTRLMPYAFGNSSVMQQTSCVSPAREGGIWAATGSGLWRATLGGTAKYIFDVPGLDNHIETIAAAPDGTVWASTTSGDGHIHLFHVQPAAHPRAISHVIWQTLVPPGMSVDNMVADNRGVAVFGSQQYMRVEPGKPVVSSKIDTGYTFNVRGAADGSYWIGCANGLMHFKDGVLTSQSGLPKEVHILGIDIVSSNELWLASDKGVIHLADGKPRVYDKAAGLPDTAFFQIQRGFQHDLWLGTNTSVINIKLSAFADFDAGRVRSIPTRSYGATDGVKSMPVSFCSAKDSQGNVWLPGFRGVTAVGQTSTQTLPPPPVVVQQCIVDSRTISPGRRAILPPGQGDLQVGFAALDCISPERVKFRYKLVGFDNDWRECTGKRMAQYTNLPPGDYTFRVIACNEEGVWSRHSAEISFRLEAHVYQTVAFRIAVAILILALLYCAYAVRIRAIRRRAEELEKIVEERTADLVQSNQFLQDMQAELEAQNDELVHAREDLAQANQHLERLAVTDGLTGLKNRRAFQEFLSREWAEWKRNPRDFSIILLDVDRFKQYNDTFGHQGGDMVLQRVAQILSTNAREIDFVARYGGEEFVVIAPITDAAGAVELAERLRQAIEAAEWPDREVTASFGVSTVRRTSTSAEALVGAADGALYQSKQAGRNRVTHAADLPAERCA